jgi:hypothetical protein
MTAESGEYVYIENLLLLLRLAPKVTESLGP